MKVSWFRRVRRAFYGGTLLNRAWRRVMWQDELGEAPRWARWRVNFHLRCARWREAHGKRLECGCTRLLGVMILYAMECPKHGLSHLMPENVEDRS